MKIEFTKLKNKIKWSSTQSICFLILLTAKNKKDSI